MLCCSLNQVQETADASNFDQVRKRHLLKNTFLQYKNKCSTISQAVFTFYLFSWLVLSFNINQSHLLLFTIFAPCRRTCKIELCTSGHCQLSEFVDKHCKFLPELSKAQLFFLLNLTSFSALFNFLSLLVFTCICLKYDVYPGDPQHWGYGTTQISFMHVSCKKEISQSPKS